MKASLQWYLGMDKSQKDQFSKILAQSKGHIVLDRLQEIIEQRIQDELHKQLSEDFNTPDFAYRQAARLGTLKAYKDILTLFDWKE
jgi:predicted RNA binding protein with dsRBD fold (UPF0201 family)